MSIAFMSHVDFKKWPCHPVEFKGQGAISQMGRVGRPPVDGLTTPDTSTAWGNSSLNAGKFAGAYRYMIPGRILKGGLGSLVYFIE